MIPFVTVAIPTHHPKRLGYLKEAVASALAQTYPSLDILINQDVGPEGLEPTLQAYGQEIAQAHPRIRCAFNTRPLGLAGNWNALADKARGEYIVIIGDDDRLLPDFVQSLVQAMPAETKTDLVYSNHYLIDSAGRRLEKESAALTRQYGRDRLPSGPLVDPEKCAWQNAIPITSALLRTDVIRRLRFKEDLNNPETELYVRLAQEGGTFVFVPAYLAEYRQHANTATGQGLYVERLAHHLMPLAVRSEIEPYKRQFLAQLLMAAVSRCLLKGDSQTAQDLIESDYYGFPAKTFKEAIQRFCARSPKLFGCPVYRFLHTLKN